MSNLKDDLKVAANLLKAGDNKKVIELLQEHAENEMPDYRVLCFLALAYTNSSDYENSYSMYKKAVQIDEANLMAWKGLFKLFEVKSLAKPDQFALRICEFMQKNGDEKRDAAINAERRLLVEMKLWTEIEKKFSDLEFAEDTNTLKEIVGLLQNDVSQIPLVTTVFDVLEKNGELKKDSEIWLIHCKRTNSTESVVELAKQYPEVAEDNWMQKKLFEYSCEEHFERETFPDAVECVSRMNISTMAVLKALRNKDTSAALEALDTVSDKTLYPDSQLFVRLLAESENWEAVEKVVQSIMKHRNSPTCNGWLARALLGIDPGDKTKLATFGSLQSDFFVEDMRIALILENEQRIQELLDLYNQSTTNGVIIRLMRAVYTLSVNSEHVKLADSLSKQSAQQLVLAAEVKMQDGLEVNTLLVKAAKLNVRCSRAFFLLGKLLGSKNVTKAKSLIERAVNIRPGNEEYVEALDNILVQQRAEPAERLKNLKALLAKRRRRQKPFWLADTLSTLYLENENVSEAIDELQQMVRLYKDNMSVWARLADAYTRKGHLRAAVSSYEQLSEIEGGHEYAIPMIRVLLQLQEFEPALEKVTELRIKISEGNLECCGDSPLVLNFTEAEIRLKLHESTCGMTKKTHLTEALKRLTECVEKEGNYTVVYKLLGDAMLVLGKYSERVLASMDVKPEWKRPADCISHAASYYMAVLRSHRNDALAWYDVCVAFLAKFKHEKNPDLLAKVQKMLEHALTLTTTEAVLSSIWTLIAETMTLSERPIRHQLHCLARALHLNKANDGAWLKLAVLCLQVGKMNSATRLLEQAIKYNPHNSDAWCAWAQHAHLCGVVHDALAMFRQALCIKPTVAAVVGYSTYLCNNIQKSNCRFDPATAALDFEPVIDLKDLDGSDDRILFHIGLLADLFGYYPESLDCFWACKEYNRYEIERVIMKMSILHPEISPSVPKDLLPANDRYYKMLTFSASDSLIFLHAEVPIYAELFRFVGGSEVHAFRKLYTSCVKSISVPLFISALITSRINLPLEFVRTIHDALPRHELIDYYPTVLPDEMDNGLRHLEQDGEEPFRYRHHIAYKLLDQLKILREQHVQKSTNSEDKASLTAELV